VTRQGSPKRSRPLTPTPCAGRFLGAPPPLTPDLLAHLTTVDYIRRFALVAIDPVSERGVAIARYAPADDQEAAEVSKAVSPGWRHAGLATVLLMLLAEAAAERGIRTFSGSYLAENRPVAALIEDAGGPDGQSIEQGIAEFSVGLGGHLEAADRGDQLGRGEPGGQATHLASREDRLPPTTRNGGQRRSASRVRLFRPVSASRLALGRDDARSGRYK
jgi:GNAT superfamily N-acetyltransferase